MTCVSTLLESQLFLALQAFIPQLNHLGVKSGYRDMQSIGGEKDALSYRRP